MYILNSYFRLFSIGILVVLSWVFVLRGDIKNEAPVVVLTIFFVLFSTVVHTTTDKYKK